jgi:putative membrane protein
MSKNSKYLAVATTLTGILALAPVFAQNQGTTSGSNTTGSQSGSSGSGSMGSGSGMSHSGSSMAGSKLSSADHKFVMEAAMGGMEEVQLGQLAAQKASDPDVKNFGQHMVDDHSKANSQLMQLASQKGVTPPTTLPAAKQKDMDKLNGLSGAAFDKAYVAMMVKDHKKDVAEFQKQAKSGKDSDLKSFAASTLPTLQDHLKMVQGIQSKMSKGGGMSSSKSGMGH